MDFNEINKFLLKRTNIYREYFINSTTCKNEYDMSKLVEDLLEDTRDDFKFWQETLVNCDYKVPMIVEKSWDSLSKEMYRTIDLVSKIKQLRGL